MKKYVSSMTVLFIFLSLSSPASALGTREAASSLILPTTGQAMNGELGRTKTKIMAGLEFGLITTVAILGVTTGGGAVLLASTPLVANHVWSSMDAYKGAHRKRERENRSKLGPYDPSLEIADVNYDGVTDRGTAIRNRIAAAGQNG